MESKKAPIDVSIEKDYDSPLCGSIPLHLVNLIQPHGLLLTLDKENFELVQVSENLENFMGLPVNELLGQPLSHFLPADQFEFLRDKIENQSNRDKIPFHLTLKGSDREVSFIAQLHLKPEYALIELEVNLQPTAKDSFMALYQEIKHITSLFKQSRSTQEIAQIVTEEIKRLTGFDRVLAYQFDPNWNGIVVGQSKVEDMDDYMDLRFPASDVPKQARDLYFRNPYRLIPARDYQPVRLLPVINPITNRFTDLSDSTLRSVAPVHLEYLTNLKVQASMSVALIIEDKLWGLISCHNKTPKNPGFEVRAAMELLCNVVSVQIAAKEREVAIELRSHLRGIHARLLEQIYTTANFAEALVSGDCVLQELFNLSGAAILFEGGIWTCGQVPSQQELKELIYWLKRSKSEKTFATDTLPGQYVRAKDYKEVASGLLVIPINSEQGEYILGFRPEVLQTISWGGNPDNAIQMEPDGKTYHPRNSFATYQQTVKNTSLPWLAEELEAAEVLRAAVLEKIIKERY
ncbi:PAS/PAC sensor protein [Rufibacter radiotolerans]|uniref:PAS/PAC sensor protein n=1 Tax=Rufibacter radiotolerans TaxID=1379910 RepID=A0A0H4VMU7_9BACT|nr:GAF domain-containing protein [Rufibacter radiotolerans]AKQ45197.1 PAS/PAC sensor protein [Rufibacter radiotolerans]